METYSPLAKLVIFKLMLVLAACQQWKLVQLDDNNPFLHGDLFEEVNMDLPIGFTRQGEFSNHSRSLLVVSICQSMALNRCSSNGIPSSLHTLFNLVLNNPNQTTLCSPKVQGLLSWLYWFIK